MGRHGGPLSGGEQQMVVLAQALVSRPKFILVDELSLGLAPVIVKRLAPVLSDVAATGVGVLLIEQFAHVALAVSKSAYVIEGGQIRYKGTAAELKERPGAAAVGVPPARRAEHRRRARRPGRLQRNRGPDGPLLGGSRPAEPAAQPPGLRTPLASSRGGASSREVVELADVVDEAQRRGRRSRRRGIRSSSAGNVVGIEPTSGQTPWPPAKRGRNMAEQCSARNELCVQARRASIRLIGRFPVGVLVGVVAVELLGLRGSRPADDVRRPDEIDVATVLAPRGLLDLVDVAATALDVDQRGGRNSQLRIANALPAGE